MIQNEGDVFTYSGDVFTYSGSGGKDLAAGNKRRTRKHSRDQELKAMNKYMGEEVLSGGYEDDQVCEGTTCVRIFVCITNDKSLVCV